MCCVSNSRDTHPRGRACAPKGNVAALIPDPLIGIREWIHIVCDLRLSYTLVDRSGLTGCAVKGLIAKTYND